LYGITSELVLQVLKVGWMTSEIFSPSVLRLNLCSSRWRFGHTRDRFIRLLLAWRYYRGHEDVPMTTSNVATVVVDNDNGCKVIVVMLDTKVSTLAATQCVMNYVSLLSVELGMLWPVLNEVPLLVITVEIESKSRLPLTSPSVPYHVEYAY
jgi:hypothetical protein